MASIFTYDPDPPRVASPWLRSVATDAASDAATNGASRASSISKGFAESQTSTTAQSKLRVTHLEAEPQEGPVEYKLHLLLRPRRRFRSASTATTVSASQHFNFTDDQPSLLQKGLEELKLEPGAATDASGPSTTTYQSRQHRLQQLTTQLLWRLQQSSPHHSSSATNMILPSLPEPLPELHAPPLPAKLLHGLEESHGALYEIGVADDGTLIGLAEDEMQESLSNLRAMASCLGCTVEVLRREVVGDCEWLETVNANGKGRRTRRKGELVVAEALVKPYLHPSGSELPAVATLALQPGRSAANKDAGSTDLFTEQLRITLTGATMSGKSSLLGTLTTTTLDNGRGKSRISMLKHRHEINSGVTSSVTQEMMGYADQNNGGASVINYAAENVASWIDMHVATNGGRLVFISDSAGHPRYRRTTLRGLVGWAPHWTLLCVPADDTEATIGRSGSTYGSQQQLGAAVPDMDLSGAQLDLCLKLNLPLVVVITKLDLASKAGLKGTLTKVLDALKATDRRPAIVANTPGQVLEADLQIVPSTAIDEVYDLALPLLNDSRGTVPIILTSALQGTGISNLHALLHELPIPDLSLSTTHDSGFIFHIEDVYHRAAGEDGVIVSGRVRVGTISVGDSATLGPFSTHDFEDSDSDERSARKPPSQLPASRSFPGALRSNSLVLPHFNLPNQEWRRFKITGVRNLRLPVHSLFADSVGTIAMVSDDANSKATLSPGYRGIRKGMILAAVQPLAVRTFTARFKRKDLESLAIGNHVVVYVASVRASARVISTRVPDSPDTPRAPGRGETNGGGSPQLDLHRKAASGSKEDSEAEPDAENAIPDLLVALTFDASREFVTVDDQVLVMPGGGPGLYGGQERGEKGLAGLDGFVGTVTEVYG